MRGVTMSAVPWIVGGLGLGLAYILYKKSQEPATPDDFCAKACKAAGSFCIDGGWSCRQTNQILGNEFDPAGVYYTERDRREGVNAGLNGAPDVTNSAEGVGTMTAAALLHQGPFQAARPQIIGAKTLRFKNGCVPMYAAPGFAQCKTGTLDMYSTAINLGAGKPYDLTEADLTAPGAYVSLTDMMASVERSWVHINKDNAMTGGSGDPATQGPFGTDATAPYWYVRGQKVIGTATTAPRAVVIQHFQISHAGAEQTRDQQIANLTDAQAMQLVPINVDPSVIQTNIGGTPCGTINKGFSWVASGASGYWTRTKVGFPDKPAPCSQITNGNANVSHTLDLGAP